MVKMIFCLFFIEIFAVSENFDDGVPVYSFVETPRLREYVPDYWQQLARGEKSDTIIKGPRNRPFLKEKEKSGDQSESEKNDENHPYHTNDKSKFISQYQNRQRILNLLPKKRQAISPKNKFLQNPSKKILNQGDTKKKGKRFENKKYGRPIAKQQPQVVIQPPQPAQPPQPGEKIGPKKKKPKFRKTIEGKVNVNRFKNLKTNALKKKFAKSKKIKSKGPSKAPQKKTSQKSNNFNQKLFNKKLYENKKPENRKPTLMIKKTPQKRNYIPVKPLRPETQKIQQKNKDVKPITGKVNIVILDMTWSEMAYWLQARTKLTNLMYNAPGKVITIALAPYSVNNAVFWNKDTFRTITLKKLNEQAKKQNSCRAINFRQISSALDDVGARISNKLESCQIFIFTDLNVPTQSRDPICRVYDEENSENCFLDKMFESRGCSLKKIYQYGTCTK